MSCTLRAVCGSVGLLLGGGRFVTGRGSRGRLETGPHMEWRPGWNRPWSAGPVTNRPPHEVAAGLEPAVERGTGWKPAPTRSGGRFGTGRGARDRLETGPHTEWRPVWNRPGLA